MFANIVSGCARDIYNRVSDMILNKKTLSVVCLLLAVSLAPLAGTSHAQTPTAATSSEAIPPLFPPDEQEAAPETTTPAMPDLTQTFEEALPVAKPAEAEEATQEGSDLPLPSFMQDDPSMTLNPADASGNPGMNLGGEQMAEQEKTPEQIDAEKRKEAFDAAIKGLLPLSPDEIRQLLEHFDRTQESVETPVYPSPKPEVAVETVSLDPGVKPVTVKVAYGNVTTLNILDVTGAPWPIEDISWAGNFEVIESSSQNGSHMLRITPQSEFATGNMSIRMLTLKTPVIISLETSRDIVHYRFDAIIPEYGPMAEAPLIDQGMTITAGDKNIASVLQGVIPQAAEKLAVAGVDARTTAYRFNGQTYVRTPLTLLSPRWSASVASADGMRVYAIQNAPVLLLSDNGKMVRARLSDRDNLLEDVSR
jgi:intracellular multiplication protein IcmK